jgi:hypothetical protein
MSKEKKKISKWQTTIWRRTCLLKQYNNSREGERKYKYVDLANSGKMRMYVCIFKIKILVFLNPEYALFFSNISLVQIYRCIYIQSCLSFTVICLFHFFFFLVHLINICMSVVGIMPFPSSFFFYIRLMLRVFVFIELFVSFFFFSITWRFRITNKQKKTLYIWHLSFFFLL